MLLVLTSTVALSVAISTAFPALIPVPITCYRPSNADTPRFIVILSRFGPFLG
ncbi:hypothetical protein PGTUg99_033947 [Puccinia graminis f. sp. tritici]|uniref:Uncharacterized protein n=1 Tax=Puccinia graminis f. sp. tritici TaxID=56615 RepID=A0A5B0RQH3_PUCGR|nr:hypothetical protein PGTUg99_001574 [Puccinia graminis f. sp. tritici]KAA1138395.1 hypothetical protein PGTUg99_033947 [Puccinia graminis f. sp. tritici]